MFTSFNPQTVTGFTAMVRMKSIIRKEFHDRTLVRLADDGILESYSYIHNKMTEFGGVDPKIHRKLLFGLIKSLPISFLIKKKLNK